MTDSRELLTLLLQRPGERPLLGSLRTLSYGMLLGLVLNVYGVVVGTSRWEEGGAFLAVGTGVAFAGWGAERLWCATAAPLLQKPFAWYAYLTRLPFWYISGGMGYVVGLLVAKKIGLTMVNEFPVKGLFESGGLIGIITQGLLQVRVLAALRRYPRRTTA